MENNNPFEVEMVKTPKEKEFDIFLQKLQAGRISFTYTKKDGSTREAEGTLNPDLIPAEKRTTDKKAADHTQNYYDFGANDWRCFIKNNLLTF